MDWLLWVAMLIAAGGSLFLALIGLPGLWFMLGVAVAYGWATQWAYVGAWTLISMLVLAMLAETIETLASAIGAKQAGASKRAMALSVGGAVLGGLAGTALLPVPVLGTIVGVCLGAFVGAVIGEAAKGKSRDQALRSGLGAAAGRLAGTVTKLAIGMVMLLIVAIAGLPAWRTSAGATPMASTPTSTPAATPTTLPATLPVER